MALSSETCRTSEFGIKERNWKGNLRYIKFCVWACFKHKLKFNWAHSPKSLSFKPREERKSRQWQKTSWVILCWLVVISWVYVLGRFDVCLCSRGWPGAHGREESAKSNGSLITWPPLKYPFLCCLVWFPYLFSGWESCYSSCFFSCSLTEFFCCGLSPCTRHGAQPGAWLCRDAQWDLRVTFLKACKPCSSEAIWTHRCLTLINLQFHGVLLQSAATCVY